MERSVRLGLLAASACLVATAVSAQQPEWTVVVASSENSGMVLPDLMPSANSFSLDEVTIANAGDARIGFTRDGGGNDYALWAERSNGRLQPFADGRTGATGPGRSGAEAGHVFRVLWPKQDSAGQTHRIFAGRAGSPTQPADAASWGLWIWNGSANREIARLETEGDLGPGFGAGIKFTSFGSSASSTDYPRARAVVNGRAVIDGTVTGSTRSVTLHDPFQGNRGCLLMGSTDPAYSPNQGVGSYFYGGATDAIALAVPGVRGDVFIRAAYRLAGDTATRRGVFEICDGSPSARALSGQTNSFGPGIPGDPDAVFTSFQQVQSGDYGDVYFWAEGRRGDQTRFYGAFHNDGVSNRPLYLSSNTDEFGPGYPGFYFNYAGSPTLFETAGQFGVLDTTIRSTVGSTNIRGLWRLEAGGSPQPLAIKGDTGEYSPGPGQTWNDFAYSGVLDSGDVIAVAQTNGTGAGWGVWRFRIGQSPVRILDATTQAQVPTSVGMALHEVIGLGTSFDGNGNALPEDYWISRSGDMIIRVTLAGYPSSLGRRFIRARVGLDDQMFNYGFD